MSSDSDEPANLVQYRKKEKKHSRKESPYEEVRSFKEKLRRPRSESPAWEETREKRFKRKDENETNRRKTKHRPKVSRHSSASSNMSSESDQEEVRERKRHEERHERHKREKMKRRSPPAVRVKEEPVSEEERDQHKRPHGQDRRRQPDQRPDRRHKRQGEDRRQGGNQDSRQVNRGRDNRTEASKYGPQDQDADAAATNEPDAEADAKDKEKPNFGLSGKLTEETNTYKGVVIKYSEPTEARKPKTRWRLYPFKGEEGLPVLYIHRQSAYLLGRERKIADIPIDHPSCSKQHAVLQYRLVPYQRENGVRGHQVRPYIIDLDSANGTYVNNKRIDPRRYVQLMEKDVLKFGFSSREYVILHDSSDTREIGDESE